MDNFLLAQSYFNEGAGKSARVGSREEDEGAGS